MTLLSGAPSQGTNGHKCAAPGHGRERRERLGRSRQEQQKRVEHGAASRLHTTDPRPHSPCASSLPCPGQPVANRCSMHAQRLDGGPRHPCPSTAEQGSSHSAVPATRGVKAVLEHADDRRRSDQDPSGQSVPGAAGRSSRAQSGRVRSWSELSRGTASALRRYRPGPSTRAKII